MVWYDSAKGGREYNVCVHKYVCVCVHINVICMFAYIVKNTYGG